MNLHPDAIAAAASRVSREWGDTGYRIEKISQIPSEHSNAAVMHVVHSDGSRFTVAADRWGNAIECGKQTHPNGLPCPFAPGHEHDDQHASHHAA